MTLREVLNKIRWDSDEQGRNYEITYLHRGAHENKRTIPFSSIEEIHSSWFTYVDTDGEEVTIPFHRVLEVQETESGKPVWKKKGRQS